MYTKEFEVPKKRTFNAATVAQFDYAMSLAEKTNSVIVPSKHVITKNFPKSQMSEAIDLMKKGESIKITYAY